MDPKRATFRVKLSSPTAVGDAAAHRESVAAADCANYASRHFDRAGNLGFLFAPSMTQGRANNAIGSTRKASADLIEIIVA